MYAYDAVHPHAVITVSGQQSADIYQYDQNGNMTCRVEKGQTFKQSYNSENRISGISRMNGDCSIGTIIESWLFAYDGDGVRVSTAHFANDVLVSQSLYYFGGAYEVSSGQVSSVRKYYSFAGQTVAMNDGTGLQYFLTDHLGSVVAITDASGTLTSQQRFLPFGQARTDIGAISQTDLGYTGQRSLDEGMGGLMDYKARFYSPALGRFIQPDMLIPNAENPQAFNRFSYGLNNPVLYDDPTGHEATAAIVPPPHPLLIVFVVITIVVLVLAAPAYGTKWDPEEPGSAANVTPYNPALLFKSPAPTNTYPPDNCPIGQCLEPQPTATVTVSPTPPKPCGDAEFCLIAPPTATATSTSTPTLIPLPTFSLDCAINPNACYLPPASTSTGRSINGSTNTPTAPRQPVTPRHPVIRRYEPI
jgi:RHS repeat-associated protein